MDASASTPIPRAAGVACCGRSWWTFLGGGVRRVILDNLKAAVTKADRYDPVFERTFEEYAAYRGFTIDPAPFRMPTGKPFVERQVPTSATTSDRPLHGGAAHRRAALDQDPPGSEAPASRRSLGVHRLEHLFLRSDHMLRIHQPRADNSTERVIGSLLAPDLLILDDFGVRRLNPQHSSDLCEVVIERHPRASTIVTSTGRSRKWIPLFDDPILAQSALPRLAHNAHQIVVDGDSHRSRQRPGAAP